MAALSAIFLALLASLAQDPPIRVARGLKYHEGKDFDNRKHRLDLYLPDVKRKVPVVMWIHGGAWTFGDKGMYGRLGRRFAREGVGLAAISYRLSPKFKHPAHVEDCARAFAWLHGHVAGHGGDPDRLFVMGHSAGGHLAALLALDPRYLKALDVPAGAVKGVIPMSGVYRIPAVDAETKGLMEMFPKAFGSDPDTCREASPLTYVAGAKAPMLVVTETEGTLLRPTMEEFREAVGKAGVKGVTFVDAKDRDHISIVVKMAAEDDDPQRKRVLEFVRSRCRELDGKR